MTSMTDKEGTLGRYFPGDTVQITRTFYTSDTRPHPPTGASVVATLMQDGTELSVLFTNVTAVSVRQSSGVALQKRAFSVSLSFQLPDMEVDENIALSVLLECEIFQSVDPQNFVMIPLHETIVLESRQNTPKGALPSVCIYPGEAVLPFAFRTSGDHDVSLSLYLGNTSVATYSDIFNDLESVKGVTSYRMPSTALTPSLMPYAALWTVDDDQELAPLFLVNPSIAMAMREVHDFVNKNTSDWASQELTFTPEQIMAALYNGACMFNSIGSPTNFTMINALGPIRWFWVQYSALWLLQSQILNSVETDFSFTTSSVTLDVDRASKYQSYADTLQSQLEDKLKPLKTVMAKRGNISGDGSSDPLSVRSGAIAAIGLSLSPVSKVGYMLNPLSWRAALLGGGTNIGFQSY